MRIEITRAHLVDAGRTLEPAERAVIARALVKAELAAYLITLIHDLYQLPAIEDVSNEAIMAGVHAVRSATG